MVKRTIPYRILTICIGIIYLWFGGLKFFSGLSPAEVLAKRTIHELTLGFVSDTLALYFLAILETTIGLLFLSNFFKKTAIVIAAIHIICTFMPLLFFPDLIFAKTPFGLTLLGQYIIKNIAILGILVFLLLENKNAVLSE